MTGYNPANPILKIAVQTKIALLEAKKITSLRSVSLR
jgi:hypothetical protein